MERGLPRASGGCRAGHGRYAPGQSTKFEPREPEREKQLMHVQGFGVTAKSTVQARRVDPTGIVCFRQADVGEYLREVSRKEGT